MEQNDLEGVSVKVLTELCATYFPEGVPRRLDLVMWEDSNTIFARLRHRSEYSDLKLDALFEVQKPVPERTLERDIKRACSMTLKRWRKIAYDKSRRDRGSD